MAASKDRKISTGPNLGRHASGCRICAHPQRDQIESDFIGWSSPAKIVNQYGLRDRSSVYRHAHALNLFPKRARNVRAALERIIERVDEVEVAAGAIVQAITAYARLNSQGQFIERREVNLHDLFERMTAEELEIYAKSGDLPPWFIRTVGATAAHGPGANENV